MKTKGTYTNIVQDMKQMGEVIENTTEALEQQGIPERTASYAAMMAFLRNRKK